MKFKSESMNLNIKDAVGYLTFKGLEKYSCINHAYSTRLGGVSKDEFKSMNLSFKCNDKRENVVENYKLFSKAAGFDYNSLTAAHQSHTCNVRVVTKKDAGRGICKPQDVFDIDALVSNETGVTLVTFHADCSPVYFLDPDKKVIGLAHAGWRGTVNGIAKSVVEKMKEEYGCKPQNIVCAVGPTIEKCCFEVGEEVYNCFKNVDADNTDKVAFKTSDNKFYANILETNKQILISQGVLEENIFISDLCTKCNCDLLISHRATAGKRGVMAAMMCLK